MKLKDWVETAAGNSRARLVIFFFFLVVIGGFAFLAWRARADLAASQEAQSSLAQQTDQVRAAGSLDDLFKKGWLADDQNFSELAGYVRKLVSLSASPSLDLQFRQELSDYIRTNRSRLPQESAQIEGLSFPEGILRQHQSRLLDMYDELGLVFQSMNDILKGWDTDTPQMRGEKMLTIQDAFSTARVEFQATTTSHRKILNYAKQLDSQSKQASTTEAERVQNNRRQFRLAVIGMIVSGVLLGGWVVLLGNRGQGKGDGGGG